MPSERAKSFYFDRNKRNKNSQLSELEFKYDIYIISSNINWTNVKYLDTK